MFHLRFYRNFCLVSSENGEWNCRNCYRKEKHKDLKTCSTCSETKSGQFRVHQTIEGALNCHTCYQSIKNANTVETCADCDQAKTGNFYNHPTLDGMFRCDACYKRDRRRGKKSLKSSPAEIVASTTASLPAPESVQALMEIEEPDQPVVELYQENVDYGDWRGECIYCPAVGEVFNYACPDEFLCDNCDAY